MVLSYNMLRSRNILILGFLLNFLLEKWYIIRDWNLCNRRLLRIY